MSRSLKIPAVVGLHNATEKIKPNDYLLIDGYLSTGFWIFFVAVLLIEFNAIFGKMYSMITSVRSVIASSLVLTFVCSGLVFYL